MYKIKNVDEYIDWLVKQEIGKNDSVSDSKKSYVSYLRSVAKITNSDISPKNLCNDDNIQFFVKELENKHVTKKSIQNYQSAMRQYVKMVNSPKDALNSSSNTKKKIKRSDKCKKAFNMPKAVTIMGRSSSITNSLINGILPVVEPSDDEIKEALKILEIDIHNVTCAYCGDKTTVWDHLHPLIRDKKPTGFISEIQNLVPACTKCNSSKGNKEWREWIVGDASKSPKKEGVKDLEQRITRLEKYEQWKEKRKIDFEKLVGKDKWEEYTNSYEKIISTMDKTQFISSEIKKIIANKMNKSEN